MEAGLSSSKSNPGNPYPYPCKPNSWERSVQRYARCVPEISFSGYDFVAHLKFSFEALERKEAKYLDAQKLLHFICSSMKSRKLSKPIHHYYNNVILEATRQNAYEVVKIIVSEFPDAIWSSNEDGHNIIQYAVINRSEKVYNLLYQMSEHKNIYRTIKDPFENNLLHLAARLAPASKLNNTSGATLQLQFELQWFKVEYFKISIYIEISLLMFLSILTAHFSEQDFLYKLPTKLIIGLTTLFISTTAMLVALGATLFLMFCQNKPLILVPIAAITCLPIACFMTLQFPLIRDLVSSTYSLGSTFGKKSDEPFY